MDEWKIGECFYKDYTLKIICKPYEKFEGTFNRECLKIVLIKKGTVIIKINNKNRVFSSPCVLCFNHQDKVALISQNTYEADCIYFHPEAINNNLTLNNIFTNDNSEINNSSSFQDKYFFTPFIERSDTYEGGINIDILMLQLLCQKFNKLQDELMMERDTFWPCRSRSILIEILILIQEKYSTYRPEEPCITCDRDLTQVAEILDYLHTNYMNKITIKDLTRHFHLNRNALNHYFLELTGNTPIAYLIHYRLKIAEKMLTNTVLPVCEICERVGFREEVNFIRSFKNHYGESPTNFRKKYGLT